VNLTIDRARPDTISVVIPAFNREQFIARAIDSVLGQTSPADEIIVVDDGSTDRTPQIVHTYRGRVGLMRIENDGSGPSRPRNVGIAAARSEYITLLDSDDRFDPTLLERHRRLLSLAPHVGLVGSNFCRDRHNNGRLEPNEPRVVRSCGKQDVAAGAYVIPARTAYAALCSGNFLTSCTGATFPRRVWESVGGFDKTFSPSEDYDFFLRVLRTHDLGYIDEPLWVYVFHHTNISAANRTGEFRPHRCWNRLRLIEREMSLPEAKASRGALRTVARLTSLDLAYGHRSTREYGKCFAAYCRSLKYGGSPRDALLGIAKIPFARLLGR
jgi:glycosyltransferase involved in cell wall biosynthesis